MINIQSRLRNSSINHQELTATAQRILTYLGYETFDLGIMLTTNATIRKYNRDYRGKDKATDVLSFPYHQINAGDRIQPQTEDDYNIGDLIISVAFVEKAAKKLGTTFDKRMTRLLIHGICHLLGHDHIEDDEFAIMIAQEKKIARDLNLVCSWE